MTVKSPTRETMMRMIPPLTVWAIGKILELPSVKSNVMAMDGRANKQRYEIQRSLKHGLKNAMSNAPWLAAGAAAILVGIGLLTKAASGK
jgi:hypothetical protein